MDDRRKCQLSRLSQAIALVSTFDRPAPIFARLSGPLRLEYRPGVNNRESPMRGGAAVKSVAIGLCCCVA
ncbi:MAG TPA: hypothetical protein VGN42_06675, partial [Pirellulales bacterium]|nr:hypothetical protein [Pirellulales bacterium]